MSILEFGKANTGQSRTKAKSRSDILGWYSAISSQVLFIMFTVLSTLDLKVILGLGEPGCAHW